MTASVADTIPPIATRVAYRDHLVALMAADERVVCLDTDTGLFNGADLGPARQRYINLGIAEHNMMCVAAGLAASGWVPYVNTMAAFASARALEAVKIDIAYNALPVRIIGTHSGVSAGHLGPTHHALDDIGTMRGLPNMVVAVPADVPSTLAILDQVASAEGPAYIRLGRGPTPVMPDSLGDLLLGRIQRLREGRSVVITCCGPLPVLAALGAADRLAAEGVDAGVLHAHTIKPFDEQALTQATSDAVLVVTVEEHWRTGGLGSVVAEVLGDHGPRPLLRIGIPDRFISTVGTQQHIMAAHDITATGIATRIRKALTRSPQKQLTDGEGHAQLPRMRWPSHRAGKRSSERSARM